MLSNAELVAWLVAAGMVLAAVHVTVRAVALAVAGLVGAVVLLVLTTRRRRV